MSYSFNVRGSSKSEVLEKVAEEMAKVVASQPVHEADQAQALAAADAFVSLVEPVENLDYSVSVNGSTYQVDGVLRGASVGVNVGMIVKVTEEPAG